MAITEYGSDTNLNDLEGKNWVATMALAWAFGLFGGHRFYTGKTTTAWIMLGLYLGGFVTCGITSIVCAIWALVDGITVALGNFTHDDGSPLYERIPLFAYLYFACLGLGVIALLLYLILCVAGFSASTGAVGH